MATTPRKTKSTTAKTAAKSGTRRPRKTGTSTATAAKKTGANGAAADGAASAGNGAMGLLRRNALPLAGALAGAAAAAVAIFFNRRDADAPAAGHPAPDLEREEHPGPDDRADPHFRPDMDAPIGKADREAFAPALERPTMVAGSETDTASRG